MTPLIFRMLVESYLDACHKEIETEKHAADLCLLQAHWIDIQESMDYMVYQFCDFDSDDERFVQIKEAELWESFRQLLVEEPPPIYKGLWKGHFAAVGLAMEFVNSLPEWVLNHNNLEVEEWFNKHADLPIQSRNEIAESLNLPKGEQICLGDAIQKIFDHELKSVLTDIRKGDTPHLRLVKEDNNG